MNPEPIWDWPSSVQFLGRYRVEGESSKFRNSVGYIRQLLRQYVHLLSELHGGNQFSREFYWSQLKGVEAVLRQLQDRIPGG